LFRSSAQITRAGATSARCRGRRHRTPPTTNFATGATPVGRGNHATHHLRITALFAAVLLSVCDSSGRAGRMFGELEWSDDPCSEGYAASRMTVIGGGRTGRHPDHPTSRRLEDSAGPARCLGPVLGSGAVLTVYASTPDYPPVRAGPVGSGSIEFRSSPDATAAGLRSGFDVPQLYFPLASIPADSRGYAFAFTFDSTAMDWQVLIADSADPGHLIVQVSDWKRQWSFGSIDLGAVDIERYLRPALADRIGSEAWSRIEASLDSLYEAAVTQTSVLNCFGLNVLEGFFVAARDRAATRLQAISAAAHCGACDATTGLFWDEWHQFMAHKQTAMIMNMALDIASAPLTPTRKALDILLDEAVGLGTGLFFDWLMTGDYACDYYCFFDATDWTFFFYVAVYHASGWIIDGIMESLASRAPGPVVPHPFLDDRSPTAYQDPPIVVDTRFATPPAIFDDVTKPRRSAPGASFLWPQARRSRLERQRHPGHAAQLREWLERERPGVMCGS
jgi:hypothetical protein